MHAAALRIELRIPASGSLKAKRRAIRPLVDGLRRSVSVSVAEIDHHDAWQRSTVGVAMVAPDARHLQRLIDEVRQHLERQLEVEVLSLSVSYLESPE